MVEQQHQHNGHELGQTLGDSEGQGSLVCCSPWGREESDTVQQLNNNKMTTFSSEVPVTLGSVLSPGEHGSEVADIFCVNVRGKNLGKIPGKAVG